jgi:hypothetical protein
MLTLVQLLIFDPQALAEQQLDVLKKASRSLLTLIFDPQALAEQQLDLLKKVSRSLLTLK